MLSSDQCGFLSPSENNNSMECCYQMADPGGGSTGNSTYYNNGYSNYQATPSPADSGVMSPMTPLSNYTVGSTPDPNLLITSPEHVSSNFPPSSSSCSPFNHPSPADSGLHCGNPSPFPMISPGNGNMDEVNWVQYENNSCWNQMQNVSNLKALFSLVLAFFTLNHLTFFVFFCQLNM